MTAIRAVNGNAAQAMEQVRAIATGSGSSFLWGMRLLPKPRRDAMYAIYAFCRAVDDIADDEGAAADKLSRLAVWREEIERLYGGTPQTPITLALQQPVRDYGLPKEEFLAVIDGMEMDAREDICAPDMATFRLYCRRVAGAVGVLSVHAFGATEPEARDLALAEGDALQFTNILRDIAEDAGRGRLYLPREILLRHGIDSRDPTTVAADPRLPAVCFDLAAMAQERFTESRRLMAACRRGPMRPARIMLAVYQRLLTRLQQQGWNDISLRVRLPKAEKLWLALRNGL
ncbi:presqualene diphosphate synthase HpnD [Pelagibius litoralis]|uniref:Presqualene diphosphate synthase HpnD n=1 Tax=Pelagibius litoralis TaxID=374515 RepID=A0A967EYL5_9PROT|nr:presqualene diphosphate synthase HpnD [Pelagibius litoralis]NIA69836.1 presqualene diphosphate synthase HpnD [Pelagibius litoralis]